MLGCERDSILSPAPDRDLTDQKKVFPRCARLLSGLHAVAIRLLESQFRFSSLRLELAIAVCSCSLEKNFLSSKHCLMASLRK